jgi:hypothetical protein
MSNRSRSVRHNDESGNDRFRKNRVETTGGFFEMRYVMLIYGNENPGATPSQAEQDAEMEAYNTFTQEVSERGILLGGEALHPTTSATTVHVRDNKVLTTDGPFAETKEQLGGFYMLECKNLDEAIEYAAKIPGARHGSIEIRPVMEFN